MRGKMRGMTEPQQPGWYPDYTQPGTERWHDGHQWTDATRSVQAAGTPSPPAGHGAPAKRRRKWPWVVAALVLLIVVISIASNAGKKSGTASTGTPPAFTSPTTATESTTPVPVTHPATPAAPAVARPGSVLAFDTGDGSKGTATITVLSAAAPSVLYQPDGGKLLGVTATITCTAGTLSINPLYFSAKNAAGDTYQVALGDAQGQMDTNDLPAGQKVRGVIAFNVPAGQKLSEIILSGPLGDQLALWHL
jgi:hypothetical protein